MIIYDMMDSICSHSRSPVPCPNGIVPPLLLPDFCLRHSHVVGV